MTERRMGMDYKAYLRSLYDDAVAHGNSDAAKSIAAEYKELSGKEID